MRLTSLSQLNKLGLEKHKNALKNVFNEQEKTRQKTSQKLQKAYKAQTGEVLSAADTLAAVKGEGIEPQAQLWEMILLDEALGKYQWKSDYKGAIPGRQFELDACIPELKIGIECDGHAYHGKFKEGFLRDREKMYLLSSNGWQVLQIQAGLIASKPHEALQRVQSFVMFWEPRQRLLESHDL